MSRASRSPVASGVWLAAPLLGLVLLGHSCEPLAARPRAESVAVLHEARAARMGQAQLEVHRFRIALARAQIEIAPLDFRTPLGEALGDADLIVNGGYFDGQGSERRAQGLVLSRDRVFAPFDVELGGGVLVVQGARARLEAADGARSFAGAELALQCSPRLIVTGARIPGLNENARAARTALCLRDRGATLEVYLTDPRSSGPTLRELADYLLEQGCHDALNLDGGPSTAAAFRQNQRVVRVGQGRELPYGIRFRRERRAAR